MLFERPVNISINPSPNAKRNGYIWAAAGGALKSIPFIIDRPNLVKKGLNPFTFGRIVDQIRKMGIEPEAIELHSENLKYVYDGKNYHIKTLGIPMSRAEIKENNQFRYMN